MVGKKAKGPQRRERAARKNVDIGKIQKNIESVYGLPANSVRIVDPRTGRNMRDDAKVRTVRKRVKKKK